MPEQLRKAMRSFNAGTLERPPLKDYDHLCAQLAACVWYIQDGPVLETSIIPQTHGYLASNRCLNCDEYHPNITMVNQARATGHQFAACTHTQSINSEYIPVISRYKQVKGGMQLI